MKLRFIAVDDEPMALDQMASYIRRTNFLEQVSLCRSGFEAMDVLSEKRLILFLPILITRRADEIIGNQLFVMVNLDIENHFVNFIQFRIILIFNCQHFV